MKNMVTLHSKPRTACPVTPGTNVPLLDQKLAINCFVHTQIISNAVRPVKNMMSNCDGTTAKGMTYSFEVATHASLMTFQYCQFLFRASLGHQETPKTLLGED
jgi:hypothetical protein